MTTSNRPSSSAASRAGRYIRATAALALTVVGLVSVPIAQAGPDTSIQKPGHVTVTVS